jgi:drug/metabolite transporter (DMT)-like permease
MPSWLFGSIVVVIGLIFLWQRHRVARLNRWWNKRLGTYGELSSSIGTPKYYGIGALLMVIAGVGIIIYSLVGGGYPNLGDPLTVIVISAIAFPVLVIVGLFLWWRKKSEERHGS